MTQNEPVRLMADQVYELRPAAKPTNNGSSDTEKNEPTTNPTGPSDVREVTTVTPVGKCPRHSRNASASLIATAHLP